MCIFNSEYLIDLNHFWDPVSDSMFLRFRNQKYGCTERENDLANFAE